MRNSGVKIAFVVVFTPFLFMSKTNTKYTSQHIDNQSFDESLQVRVTELIGADGVLKNPATEESVKGIAPLSGAGANGTRELTSANTWYSVPSTVPASPYVLVVTQEVASGTIRFGFDNTDTPSATNGNQAPAQLTLKLAASQVVYFASSTALDDVNWSTKVI